MKNSTTFIALVFILIINLMLSQCSNSDPESWESEFQSALTEAGHRNWIVIADAAYPKQSAPGILTIATGEDHISVLKTVLSKVEEARHVNSIIMVDAELEYVPEQEVKGIENYRSELGVLLQGKQVSVLGHEQIISKLDEASQLFTVLILKTTMDMPYTSVFIELDCGYWDGEQEGKLRKLMEVE